MAGLLEWFNSPAGIGLLSTAAGAMAGARRGQPWNTAGRGAVAGLTGYAQAQDQLRADEENAFQKQFRQTQMEQMQRQLETQRKQEQWRAGLPAVMAAKVSDQGAMLNEQNAAFGDEGTQATMDAGQYAPNAQLRMTPQVDSQAVHDYMLQPESPYADKLMERQLFPSAADYKTVGKTLLRVGANGQVDPVYTDSGNESQSDIGKLIAERDKFQPGHPARSVYDNAIKKLTTHAPAVQVNNNAPGAKYNEGVDKLGAELLFNQYGEANNAATAINAVRDANTLLDKGMFTGKFGPAQEAIASWYQGATGRPIPTLDATQQFKTVIGDIVLPALSSLKGASSDNDFRKLEEYSRGEVEMTEQALRNHLRRLENKYGAQISNYNRTFDDYSKARGVMIPGVRRVEMPSGNIKNDAQGGLAYSDPEKESRYQEWKRSQGK